MIAWHFCKSEMVTQFDGRPIVVGEWLEETRPLELCRVGLHASERIIHALQYAPGPVLCRVEIDGEIRRDSDKLCASRRRVLRCANIERYLHEFACRCAEDVIPIFEREYPGDSRPRKVIEAKQSWLRGEITDEQLDAARDAARAAALDADSAAVMDAARAAARAAAWAAAWAAARAAARAAAWADALEKHNGWLLEIADAHGLREGE